MYSVIDIETTGGNAWTDRITEVAVYVYDGQKIIREFSSLVNPERKIPPFVVRLTGITDEMVEDAPRFQDIAREIIEITEGTIFVGHNVQFDYGFIRQEFKNLGYHYDRKTLCTCKLSRKLIPGHTSYSLGRLCQSLGIQINGRHRAAGDAAATVELFERILSADIHGELENALKPVGNALLPDCLDIEKVYSLPEKPGVYYFHDQSGEIIYIGKSKNIRKRVLSHFKKKNPAARDARIKRDLGDVTFHITGSELIALLMESDEIKKHQPRYNKAQKAIQFDFGIFERPDESGYLSLFIARVSKQTTRPIACYKNAEQAQRALEQLVNRYNLCTKLCGIEKKDGACFNFQVKKCLGACLKSEPVHDYNLRVETALSTFGFKHPHFLIIDRGRTHHEKSVVKVENGHYSGFGYFDPAVAGENIENIKDAVKNSVENPDIYHIISAHLKATRNIQLLTF